MLDPDTDAPLDAAFEKALSRLATVRAPETLLPRVLTATRRLASQPWYARTWDAWPVAYQRTSLAVCLLVLGAMTLTTPSADGTWVQAIVARAGGLLGPLP